MNPRAMFAASQTQARDQAITALAKGGAGGLRPPAAGGRLLSHQRPPPVFCLWRQRPNAV